VLTKIMRTTGDANKWAHHLNEEHRFYFDLPPVASLYTSSWMTLHFSFNQALLII
jgi:hypothetical protein